MSVYHEKSYQIINYEIYMTAQVNFIKNKKNVYHNVLN